MTIGVLEYYNANLENVMHYGELKTDVFQAFREVGNVIVFCLLIEQEMVRSTAYVIYLVTRKINFVLNCQHWIAI